MKITFHGAVDDVTGAMTLVESGDYSFLVDAGMTQGTPDVLKKNLEIFPFDLKKMKAIVLTHAHLDHSGFIPRLVKLGFRGKIYCTKATAKLVPIILKDSANLLDQNPDIHFRNLYSMEDVTHALSLFKAVNFDEQFSLGEIKATFQYAGHILGAASLILKGNKTVVFSGDLGRNDDPLMRPPLLCPPADLVIMESTYGNRVRHAKIDVDLDIFIREVKAASRVGIVATFAVARAQMLLVLLHEYFEKYPDRKVRVVLDGPMMSEASKVYQQFSTETKKPQELFQVIEEADIIEHTGQWESIKKKNGPLIILSSSGMLTGGRIWRYLRNWENDKNAMLFLPGFQGPGTPGRQLAEGNRQLVDAEGEGLFWRGEIMYSEAFSSHADQNELLHWVSPVDKNGSVILMHGEGLAKRELRQQLGLAGFSTVDLAQAGKSIDLQ